MGTDIAFKVNMLDKVKASLKKRKEVLMIAREYGYSCRIDNAPSTKLFVSLLRIDHA